MSFGLYIDGAFRKEYNSNKVKIVNETLKSLPNLKKFVHPEVFLEVKRFENPLINCLSEPKIWKNWLTYIDSIIEEFTFHLTNKEKNDFSSRLNGFDLNQSYPLFIELMVFGELVKLFGKENVIPYPKLSNGGKSDFLIKKHGNFFVEVTTLCERKVEESLRELYDKCSKILFSKIPDNSILKIDIDTSKLVWKPKNGLDVEKSQQRILESFYKIDKTELRPFNSKIKVTDDSPIEDAWILPFKRRLVEIHSQMIFPSKSSVLDRESLLNSLSRKIKEKNNSKQREPGFINLLFILVNHWAFHGWSDYRADKYISNLEFEEIKKVVEKSLEEIKDSSLSGIILFEDDPLMARLIENPSSNPKIPKTFPWKKFEKKFEIKKIVPEIKSRRISETRRKYVVRKIIKTVKSNSLARYLIPVVLPNKKNEMKFSFVYEKPFSKLGVNLIMDKIWFVDCKGEKYYSYKDIGFVEGQSIANGETKGVIEQILRKCHFESVNDKIKSEYLNEIISKFEKKKFKCNRIVTNTADVFDFWDMKNFKGYIKTDLMKKGLDRIGLEGMYVNIPVYWSRFLPKGTTLFIDRNKIGKLFIKRDISVDITEIKEEEKENILKSLPRLKGQDFREKVRLYADEIIRFELLNENATIAIKRKLD